MDTWTCGPILAQFEPPDVLHCHVRSTVEEGDTREALRIAVEEVTKRGIRAFFVVHLDMTDGGSPFTSGARKYLGTTKMADWKGIIVAGGSPIMRVAASVLRRAYSLLYPQTVPSVIVKAMEDAREFMEEIRAKEAAPKGEIAKSA